METTEKKPTVLGLKKELDSFKKEVLESQGKILTILEGLQKPATPIVNQQPASTMQPISQTPANSTPTVEFLPKQYQDIVDKYFDPTDGFQAKLSFPTVNAEGRETGGITFTIIVPEKFTNMNPAQKQFYKTDVRMVVVDSANVAASIEGWCKKVSQNLKYQRNVRMK